MTTHRLLRAATFAALATAWACTATIGDDEVDDFAADALASACTNLTMTVVPLRDEMRFGVSSESNDRAALNPRIPAERICDRIIEARDRLRGTGNTAALASADQCVSICDDAERVTQASPVRGSKNPSAAQLSAMGELADAFNAALGNDTNFAGAAGQGGGGNASDGSGDALICTNRVFTVVQQGRENRFGLDGKAVALNPAIPVDQVCNEIAGRVQNQGLSAECNVRCGEARTAAANSGVRGFQDTDPVKLAAMQKLVDQLNGILGKATNFGAPAAGGESGGAAAGGNDDNNNNGQLVCTNKIFAVVQQGNENRFGINGAAVALNPAIPVDQVCNEVASRVQNQGLSAECNTRCNQARVAAVNSGVRGFQGTDPVRLAAMQTLVNQLNTFLGNR